MYPQINKNDLRMRDGRYLVSLICLQNRTITNQQRYSTENGSMRATSVNVQTFDYTRHGHVELVPCSVYVIGNFIFMFAMCFNLFNVTNIIAFSHVDSGTHALVSTCAALLLALLLSLLTLTCLARLNGLRSLVGLTMRLATNSA